MANSWVLDAGYQLCRRASYLKAYLYFHVILQIAPASLFRSLIDCGKSERQNAIAFECLGLEPMKSKVINIYVRK